MDNNDSIKPQQTGGLKLMTVFIAVLALHVLVIGGFTVYHLMGSGGSDADLTLDKTHKLKADGTVATDTATPDATAPSTTGTATATAAPAASTTATVTPAATPAPTQVAATTPAAPAPVETNPATPASSTTATPIVLNNDDMSQTSTIPEGLAPPPEPTLAPNGPSTASVVAAVQKPVAPAAPTPTPAPIMTPAVLAPTPAVSTLSSSAPSGPVIPESHMAAGPVHMPANPPTPAAPTTLAQGEEHASAPAVHEEHAATVAHEAKKEFYTVKITDSYKKIALAYHITVAELKEANHVKGNTLHAGEKLIIPQSKTSIAKTEKTHETPVSETASTASLSASPTGSAKTHRHYYTVAKGDTLKYIAKKFDVTTSALKEANDLSSTKLVAGEKLRIPSHEARTASASTSSPVLTDRVATPVYAPQPAPAVIQPSQVETQPAPVEQPAPTTVAEPVPQPTPPSSPELTSLNF